MILRELKPVRINGGKWYLFKERTKGYAFYFASKDGWIAGIDQGRYSRADLKRFAKTEPDFYYSYSRNKEEFIEGLKKYEYDG